MQSEESSKKFNLGNFAFYNFFENLCFRQLEEDWPTLQLLKYHMESLHTKTKFIYLKTYRRKTARTAIISEMRNFAFYNFCQNLGFQSSEEGWAALQLLLISGSIITISKCQGCLQKKITKFHILQLFLESWFSAVTKGFGNFTATQNITWNHYNIKVCKKDYSQSCFQKIQYFAKFCILQLLLESWHPSLRRGLGNFTLLFISRIVSLKCQSFIENLQLTLFSENLVFCEISHFTTCARILVFNPYKRIGQLCSSLL